MCRKSQFKQGIQQAKQTIYTDIQRVCKWVRETDTESEREKEKCRKQTIKYREILGNIKCERKGKKGNELEENKTERDRKIEKVQNYEKETKKI